MSPYVGLIDLAIVVIPAGIFCVWQLISINREIAKDRAAKEASTDAALPESSGHPVGEHRLDDR